MKINVFLSLYGAKAKHKAKTPDEMISILGDLLKPKPYIKYDDKLRLIDLTLEQIKDSPHPTADRYRQFIVNMISAYTELELDIEGFDILMENNVLDAILSIFEQEYEFCTSLMNMCMRDKESR